MSILGDFKKSYVVAASTLGDYQGMSVDQLADGYCLAMDTNDEQKKDAYCAALMLRFWFTINKLYVGSPNIGLDREDFHSWLFEAISYACKPNYRAWQNPEKNCNAQQAINQCINTIRLQHYYEYNLDKHKANYNTTDLDRPCNSEDDKVTIGDTIMSDDTLSREASGFCRAEDIIQEFINNRKLVEAIIFDNIANQDPFRHDKKVVKEENGDNEVVRYTEYSTQFWPYKLVRILSDLPQNYFTYFKEKYAVNTKDLQIALEAVQTAPNRKLYNYIDKAVDSLKIALNK